MESKKGTPVFRRIWGLICLLLVGVVAYVLFDASNGAGGLDTNLGSVLFYLCAAFAVLFLAFAVYTLLHWEDGLDAMAVGGTIALVFVTAYLVVWSFFSMSIAEWLMFWGVALAAFVCFINLRTELYWKQENAAKGRTFDVSAARNKLIYNKIVCFAILPLIIVAGLRYLIIVAPSAIKDVITDYKTLTIAFVSLIHVLIALLIIALAVIAMIGLLRGCACGMTATRFSLLSVLLPVMVITAADILAAIWALIFEGLLYYGLLMVCVPLFVGSLLFYIFTSKYYKRNKEVFEN